MENIDPFRNPPFSSEEQKNLRDHGIIHAVCLIASRADISNEKERALECIDRLKNFVL